LIAINKTFYAKDRAAWRAWLRKHSISSSGIWLLFYKKASGKPCISYDEAVEAALCFGWIDSVVKAVDDAKYAQRFTPRKPKSLWSASNLERMRAMIAAGLVTRAGIEAFEGHGDRMPAPLPTRLPAALERRFRTAAKAWKNFAGFAPGYRRASIGWVASAKLQETRERRLSRLIEFSARNERLTFI
jgi:uncharacterized protein YdeI (YjbR/CyaY-like superfamily)